MIVAKLGDPKCLQNLQFEFTCAHEKKNCHRELTVSSLWAHGDHGGHCSWPNDHGSVTARRGHSSVMARSRLGHSSVTARSQLNHGIFSMITAQSRLGHSSITAQVTAQSRLAVTILVTVSSRWADTVAIFFLMGDVILMSHKITQSLGSKLRKHQFTTWSIYFSQTQWCSLIDNYVRHKTPCGIRKLTAAFVSKIGVFSRFSWSLDFGTKMAEFPLPVLQICQSQKTNRYSNPVD